MVGGASSLAVTPALARGVERALVSDPKGALLCMPCANAPAAAPLAAPAVIIDKGVGVVVPEGCVFPEMGLAVSRELEDPPICPDCPTAPVGVTRPSLDST